MKAIDTLEPEFKIIVLAILSEVEAVTLRKWGVAQGRRTIAYQDHLYAQGRTAHGDIVTNAKGGQSAHNFGMAADIVPMKADGSDFDWNAPDDLFNVLAVIAQKHGMTAGYYFKSMKGGDPDHIEDPRWKQAQADWCAGKLTVS